MKLKVSVNGEIFSYAGPNSVVKIGRSTGNDLVIGSNELSREHCILEVVDDEFYLTDVGSKNGVNIDGIRIIPLKKVKLNPNMDIKLAGTFPVKFNNQRIEDEPTIKLNLDIPYRPARPTLVKAPVVEDDGIIVKRNPLVPILIAIILILSGLIFFGR